MIWPIENFLELPEVQKVMKNSYFCMFSEPQNPFLREYQIQKLACAHVVSNLKRLRRCMMTPFVSACSYDPKEVFRNLLWHRSTLRKILTALAGETNFSQNTTFLSNFWMPKTQSYQNHVKIAKNEHLLTFLLKNFFWWVVRQHRRFQKMPEIPKTCLTTYSDVATSDVGRWKISAEFQRGSHMHCKWWKTIQKHFGTLKNTKLDIHDALNTSICAFKNQQKNWIIELFSAFWRMDFAYIYIFN